MSRKRDPQILVFDSGFGGLSVLLALRARLPFANYVFLADDARFPYGDLQEEELIIGLVRIVEDACRAQVPDLLVVACNTASTIALDALRSRFDFPIVGIVPAIKPAALASLTGQFAVLATPGTIGRSYTQDLIRDFASGCEVRLVPCTRLARLAEEFVLSGARNEATVVAELAPAFAGEHGDLTDTLVLGCTHYPLLLPVLEAVVQNPVLFVDPAHAVARRVMHLLGQEWQDCVVSSLSKSAILPDSLTFLATGGGAARLEAAWRVLGNRLGC